MQSGVGRARRRAGTIGAAVAVIAFLLVARPAAGDDEPGMDEMELLPPGDWTPAQQAYMLDLIARTEAALPAFGDSSTLEALGFYDFGVTAPGGYDHWINPGWIDDDHTLDPAFPESLVFQYTDDGGYELVAAMFILSHGHDMSNIPDDIGWLYGWHVHDDLCVDEDGRFAGLVFDGECGPGATVADFPPMAHVWIEDNPCGHRFAAIDVGGVVCEDDHGHGGHDGGHGDDGGHMPGDDHGDGHGGHDQHGRDQHHDCPDGRADRDGHDDSWMGDHCQPLPAPPARPIPAQPHVTG